MPDTKELAASVIAGFGIIISAVVLLLPTIITQAYATPVPVFEPLDHVYNLTIENQSYPIRYGFSEGNGVVENMYANFSSKSITVIINDNLRTTNRDRLFLIELPRNMINANTTEIAGGCTSFAPTNNTVFWKQEHDIEYDIAVTTLSESSTESNTAIYNGNQAELCGPNNRTLSIEYPTGGKSMIVIQGTAMIPEFGSSTIILLVATISGAIIVASCYRAVK